jgi:small subunit ribosomal protein S17
MSRPCGIQRRMRGVVVSDGASKMIAVQVTRRFRHPKYGKMVNKNHRIHAHDETNEAHLGDTVEVMECRPMSRLKRFRLVCVLERNPERAVTPTDASPAEGTPAQ